MSSYPLVKFVDGPSTGATVRLDLNDAAAAASRRVEADVDLGVPTLEGDPNALGQTFGLRSPRFTVQVKGTKANALAFVSALSKELLRRTNWVMFQLNAATSPVWFKTYRSGYQSLSLDQVYGNAATGGSAGAGFPDVWRVEVPLVADAFAYGARQTMSTFQVVQSPADLTAPTRTAMRVVLPAIKGDAPTPLRVTVTPNASWGLSAVDCSWLIGCVSGSTTMADAVVDIGTGDGFTAGTGTGAGVSSALYFGGSYRSIALSGSTFISRLTGFLPALPLGRYKVLLRFEIDGGTGARSFLFRFNTATAGGEAYFTNPSATVTVPGAAIPLTKHGWVDLGDVMLPAGGVVVGSEAIAGQPAPSPTLPGVFDLQVGSTSATGGTVRIDALKLIPIGGPTVSQATLLSSTFTRSYFPGVSGSTLTGTWDGDTESYWTAVVSGAATPGLAGNYPIHRGSYPIADPVAAQNLLLVMAMDMGQNTSTTPPATGITTVNAQCAVDVSYYPRYLHIGDGT